MLKKTGSKKGFTLAELLIVVAIIAVLTAIAVPLFVASLDQANDAAKNSNISAVRSAAIVKILATSPTDDTQHVVYDESGKMVTTGWTATGVINKSGKIQSITLKAEKFSGTEGDASNYSEDKEANTITITIGIDITDVTLATGD